MATNRGRGAWMGGSITRGGAMWPLTGEGVHGRQHYKGRGHVATNRGRGAWEAALQGE